MPFLSREEIPHLETNQTNFEAVTQMRVASLLIILESDSKIFQL